MTEVLGSVARRVHCLDGDAPELDHLSVLYRRELETRHRLERLVHVVGNIGLPRQIARTRDVVGVHVSLGHTGEAQPQVRCLEHVVVDAQIGYRIDHDALLRAHAVEDV